MKKHLWWILSLIVIVVIIFATTNSANAPAGDIDKNEHIKGNPDSSIVLIEYSDFQCPACASAYPSVERLAKEVDVKIVYRHYPLTQLHPNAILAAKAAEAAALQGKFWDMHDMLFNTQSEWANNAEPELFFATLAESIGLNIDQFTNDIHSNEVKKSVSTDAARANKLRLPGTPTFILNGKQLEDIGDYESFKSQVEAAQQR